MGKTLREGFTTGTAAAAAAKAAALLLRGENRPERVNVPLPSGARMDIIIDGAVREGQRVRAGVIKDGGDDPDATHGLRIEAVVEPGAEGLTIQGGRGVGRATLPGLPIPVGASAINPAPLEQIARAVREAGLDHAHVLIEVPGGTDAARHTFNPRLGIIGGISILGTRGTVKPFSHEAYRATIISGLEVVTATGLSSVFLSTGGRSERFLRREFPKAPLTAFVQVADFFEFSMRECAARNIARVTWGVFFGKLMKMASGAPYTHARSAGRDFAALADICAGCGLSEAAVAAVRRANTGREALGHILAEPAPGLDVLTSVTNMARNMAGNFASGRLEVVYLLFDFDGKLLLRL